MELSKSGVILTVCSKNNEQDVLEAWAKNPFMVLQRQFADFESFLQSLDIHLTVEAANEFNISRIAQMTQKTNQFNLTTKRYTDADIKTMLAQQWKAYCISVADRFGDSGITGCVLLNGDEIDTFLLSCRVLGKGIETAFMKKILQLLKGEGKKNVRARFVPTAKNAQVKDFYEKCGFICVSESDSGTKDYVARLDELDLNVKDYFKIDIK